MNLFERKTEICYCVPNGASACAPCRERLAAKNAEKPTIIGVDFGKEESFTIVTKHRQGGLGWWRMSDNAFEKYRESLLRRLGSEQFFKDMYLGKFPNE